MKLEPVDKAVDRYMNEIKTEAKATGINLVQKTVAKKSQNLAQGDPEYYSPGTIYDRKVKGSSSQPGPRVRDNFLDPEGVNEEVDKKAIAGAAGQNEHIPKVKEPTVAKDKKPSPKVAAKEVKKEEEKSDKKSEVKEKPTVNEKEQVDEKVADKKEEKVVEAKSEAKETKKETKEPKEEDTKAANSAPK